MVLPSHHEVFSSSSDLKKKTPVTTPEHPRVWCSHDLTLPVEAAWSTEDNPAVLQHTHLTEHGNVSITSAADNSQRNWVISLTAISLTFVKSALNPPWQYPCPAGPCLSVVKSTETKEIFRGNLFYGTTGKTHSQYSLVYCRHSRDWKY